MEHPFEIIVGTYEQYLLGYRIHDANGFTMEKSFATHSHAASIRSIASNKHYLASAGADDIVCLYDMRYRIESGRLIHHSGTINSIAFTPEGSHLFTCSNDGSIAAIRCGNWQIEKHWQKAHKGLAVNTLAIHPTGKIGLSAGADGVLRTWNLIKGRQAYATNLVPKLKSDAKNVTIIKWSPSGEKYLLVVNQRIDVYSVEFAGIEKEIMLDSKIICIEFLKDDLIVIGLENGQIKFYDLKTSLQTVEVVAHNIRVKSIAHVDDFLISASSSGEIKLWRYDEHKLDMLQSINCGTRITCLCLIQAYKNSVQQKELELKEVKEVKKKSKVLLKQEVIIENEGEWDVTDVIPEVKISKTRHKKKRSLEDTKDNEKDIKKKIPKLKEVITSKNKRARSLETENTNGKSKKEKKNETHISSKKQNKSEVASTIILPRKKKRKINNVEQLSIACKNDKVISVTDVEDVPKKTKKKRSTDEIVALKKKKKKTLK